MKRLISIKLLVTAALVLGGFAVASAAHARSDLHFSIGIQSPGYYVQPAPVYVQPRPVYLPAPSYYGRRDNDRRHGGQYRERRGPYGDRDRDGIVNVYDRDDARHQWRHARLYGPYGDLDRDGIRNRFDRVPNNSYRW